MIFQFFYFIISFSPLVKSNFKWPPPPPGKGKRLVARRVGLDTRHFADQKRPRLGITNERKPTRSPTIDPIRYIYPHSLTHTNRTCLKQIVGIPRYKHKLLDERLRNLHEGEYFLSYFSENFNNQLPIVMDGRC